MSKEIADVKAGWKEFDKHLMRLKWDVAFSGAYAEFTKVLFALPDDNALSDAPLGVDGLTWSRELPTAEGPYLVKIPTGFVYAANIRMNRNLQRLEVNDAVTGEFLPLQYWTGLGYQFCPISEPRVKDAK